MWESRIAKVRAASSPADPAVRKGVSNDENARLRPQPRARMTKGTHRVSVELGPHEVKFWSFE